MENFDPRYSVSAKVVAIQDRFSGPHAVIVAKIRYKYRGHPQVGTYLSMEFEERTELWRWELRLKPGNRSFGDIQNDSHREDSLPPTIHSGAVSIESGKVLKVNLRPRGWINAETQWVRLDSVIPTDSIGQYFLDLQKQNPEPVGKSNLCFWAIRAIQAAMGVPAEENNL